MAGSLRLDDRVTITCADCGTMQMIPRLSRLTTATCARCARLLSRGGTGIDVPLASAIASFILLPPAVFMPLMDSTIRNLVFEESRLMSSVGVIYQEVWFPFAFGFLFFAVLFPALRALFQIVVLGSIRFGWKIWQRGRLFRWSEELRIWSMTDVVVIAGVVAYFRAEIPADVELRAGAWCYVAVATCALITDLAMDRRDVWNAILPDKREFPPHHMPSCDFCELVVGWRRSGDPCPRCGEKLDHDIVPQFAPALGAVAAAIPLTLPAYAAAVMVNDQLTGVLEHTVIGTVQLMADRGYWQMASILLIAGVVVPLVVLAGMIWLLARVRFPERNGLVLRTRVYRGMHKLVRWPMIIPFIAAIAAPIVDFRGIDDIVAGPGATPLFALIALLILAVRLFEPRLMWKTAGVSR
ncbi:MAG: paraquat-inducible protein A [Thermoanaerobaculia bacterium]